MKGRLFRSGWWFLVLAFVLNFLAIIIMHGFANFFQGFKSKIDVQYDLYLFFTGHYYVLPSMGPGKKLLVITLFVFSYFSFCISAMILTYQTIRKHYNKKANKAQSAK